MKGNKMGKFGPIIKVVLKKAGKSLAKTATLKALKLKDIKPLNAREDCVTRNYNNKSSPLYKNSIANKECYNPNLPIDKDPKKWKEKDLFSAMESPLYKYDKKLQNMAKDYIRHRTKKRFNGLK